MKISCWNVNSVRARVENIKSYLLKYKPDILMMQEIKTEDPTFPYDDFSALDYESHVFGQKSYNGVAIISKHKLENIKIDLIKDKLKQSRIISAEVKFKKKNKVRASVESESELNEIEKDLLIKEVRRYRKNLEKNYQSILIKNINYKKPAIINLKNGDLNKPHRLYVLPIFIKSGKHRCLLLN